jgi:hypothetical protein
MLHLTSVLITVSTKRYSVRIYGTETVAKLKTAILNLKNLSRQIEDLDIWKVSLPIDEGLTESVKQAISDEKTILFDHVKSIDVFPFTFKNHLHMVVEAVGEFFMLH